MKNYFEGSVGIFLSFMVKENKISDQEIAELQNVWSDNMETNPYGEMNQLDLNLIEASVA